MLNRRGFLRVLSGLVAAPAVCKAEILMPVRSIIVLPKVEFVGMAGFESWYLDVMKRQAEILAKQISDNIMYGNPLLNGLTSADLLKLISASDFRIIPLDKPPRFR